MASNLFKVLNTIEEGRKSCVATLQSRGFPLSDDASLATVASRLEMLPYEDTSVMADISKYVQYYDNPEDDPEVWHMPEDWPDYVSIFKACEDIKDSTNTTMMPLWMALLDNEADTIRFTINKSNLAEEHAIYIDSHTSSFRWMVKTSDGASYELDKSHTQTTGHVHTWDKTQDINGKYRYFIVYAMPTTAYAMCREPDVYNVNILGLVLGSPSYGNYQIFRYGTGFPKLQHVYAMKPITTAGKNCKYPYSRYCLFSGSNAPELRCIEEHGDDSGAYVSFSISSPNKITKVIRTNTLHPHALGLGSYSSAIYIKAPVVSGGTARRDSTSYEPHTPSFMSKLKYLEVDEKLMSEYYKTNTLSGLASLPFLKSPELITKHITKIACGSSTTESDFYCSFLNSKLLDLSHLQSVSGRCAIDCSYAEIIDLSSLESLSGNTAILRGALNCKTVLLDKLKEIVGSFNVPNEMIVLNLPSLEKITGTFSAETNPSPYPIAKLMEINAPLLHDVSNPKAFYYLYMLHTITLPDQFKYSLDLYNQSLLSRETVLDLLNKAADVREEGTEYYLRFHSRVLNNLTEEDKQIATAKGWIIKN